jgi:hypothetical protein
MRGTSPHSDVEAFCLMNYPAASYGVSIGSYHNASRGGESNLYPPQEGLSASGGLMLNQCRLWSI